VSRRFGPATEAALRAQGWRLTRAPAGITLAGLRAAGAPFKSSKYFDQQAAATVEAAVAGGDVAYRPGLLPGSLNEPHAALPGRLAALQPLLPPGAVAGVGPAALYVWLLVDHHAREGEWPLRQCFTWTADASGETHLAVGVFGRERPLIVSPIPEASGRGLGLMPLIFPG
jgi:hypothetical protein